MDNPLIAIVGPTAVGKSALAIKLAQEFHGEIVSADSRQVYRGMDIGTAKPTREEQALVPHHLIDLVGPDGNFTLAQYQQLAFQTIAAIHARGHLPILVGGSGLYVRAVLDGLTIPRVEPNLARRRELASQPADQLYARLQTLDPTAASRIDPLNSRRVIRALEVCEATHGPISWLQSHNVPNYSVLRIGLTMPRNQLYERINARVDEMIARGLVDEVRALMQPPLLRGVGGIEGASRGISEEGITGGSMTGLGYRQIAMYLNVEIDLEEAVRLFKRDTRRFVHHQYSWFRLDDLRIKWFDVSVTSYNTIRQAVANFLAPPES
jgi:tRNA dimethylallyltransferase